MIGYDPTAITIQIVRLKSVTTVLGGSISIINEELSTPKKEVLIRMECPLSVARAFIQKHKKVTKYLIPVVTAIVKYEDKIICLERHPLGTFGEIESLGLDGEMHEWIPDSQRNLERYIDPLTIRHDREWFFDGRYIYSFNNLDVQKEIDKAPYLTENGQFRKLEVMSVDTQELANADKITPVERTCVAFICSNGEYSISPPIWKDLGTVGVNKLDNDTDDVVKVNMGSFDKIDEQMSVNLNFALITGRQIGLNFGYEYVEPLQLPRLMLDLHTVNLPGVAKQIKATYDIGLKFTHCMAWLLGLQQKADDLDTYIMMRSLLKYLTQKGIYRSTAFKAQNIFLADQTLRSVKLKSLNELMNDENYTRLSLSHIIEAAKNAGKRKSPSILNIAGMKSETD